MTMNLITQWCESDCFYDWEYVVQHKDSNGNIVAEKVFTDYDMALHHIRINSGRR